MLRESRQPGVLVASRSNAAKNKEPLRLCLDHLELQECCQLEGDHLCGQYERPDLKGS